jgi:AraC-like DNA-binding protein
LGDAVSETLAELIKRYTEAQPGQSPFFTAVGGLTILCSDHQRRANPLVYKPALCITVQGAKSATFGDQRHHYSAGQALLVSVEMPGFGTVTEASPAKPYLGIILELDLAILRAVASELADPPKPSENIGRGVFVTDFDGPLADCTLRIVRLLDTPTAIPVLYPAIMREISYWLLSGPHGGDVARMTLCNNHEHRILQAIHFLRDRFAEPVRIGDLASIAQLSPSAFHRQFKAVTSMTPLQYQKQLRLLEARRLMTSDAANVEKAAFQVGYESASQFSREYGRMFGMSPRRDVNLLKRAAA